MSFEMAEHYQCQNLNARNPYNQNIVLYNELIIHMAFEQNI